MAVSTKRGSLPCQRKNPPRGPGIPPVQRENNSSIMETFIYSAQFSDRELTLLNYCRLYLKVFHVSDLSTSDGKQFRAN
eukprot:6636492-Ditylum_brightwellii.AAC.1